MILLYLFIFILIWLVIGRMTIIFIDQKESESIQKDRYGECPYE